MWTWETNSNALDPFTVNGIPFTPSLSPPGRGEGEGGLHVKEINAFVFVANGRGGKTFLLSPSLSFEEEKGSCSFS